MLGPFCVRKLEDAQREERIARNTINSACMYAMETISEYSRQWKNRYTRNTIESEHMRVYVNDFLFWSGDYLSRTRLRGYFSTFWPICAEFVFRGVSVCASMQKSLSIFLCFCGFLKKLGFFGFFFDFSMILLPLILSRSIFAIIRSLINKRP